MVRTRSSLLLASALVLVITPAGFAQVAGGSADPVPGASRAVRFAVSEAIRLEDGEIDPLPATKTAPPAPLVSFDGLSSADNLVAFGFRTAPANPNLDVGPNHVVAATNLLVRIYDKAGNALTAPFKQSSVFAALGGTCATGDDGEPIVLYDALADRWLISQVARPNSPDPPYSMCIGISMGADPTGAYFLYEFLVGGPTGNQLPLGPKLGVWPDGYYLGVGQFTNGLTPASAGAAVFDRVAMLRGDPAAQQIYFDLSTLPYRIGVLLPSDLDGPVPPPAGTPNLFATVTAEEFGGPADALRLYDFHADFATPASSTFTERAESPLAVAAFDPRPPAGLAHIAQPGTSVKLDASSGRLMHRLQYRHRGGFESFVVNHTVDASGDPSTAVFRAGVRFYELRRTPGAANPISVFEQATFGPGDTESRWMGSAAVDNDGNLAFGYSVSSATVFPSIRYAGKLAGEAVGVLAERLLVAGSGVQTSTLNRWGEHSMLAVDPADDCTFWYTQQYYTAASQATSSVGWLTRIASFRYPQCTVALQGTLQGTITDCGTGQPIPGALVTATGGYAQGTLATGAYSFATIAAGTYTVKAGDLPGYDSASQAGVSVGNGGTTTVDVCLSAIPILGSAGATIVPESETCVAPNGTIDPGETVTARFCTQNTGTVDTVDLIATLQATGGVTTPSGPQSYGVVVSGGPPVCRNYTLVAAGGCGGTLTASLRLRDGPRDLGVVTYAFTLGAQGVQMMERFDGVVAPALPAGWVATTVQDVASISSPWSTNTTTPDTPPNSAFTNDPGNISDEVLDTPPIAIASSGSFSFRHIFNLESTFDGGVLEVAVNGAPFQDILAAGGTFIGGGYNATIRGEFGNPLANRQAWSGASNDYVTSIVNLPASAAGQSWVFRFRRATDRSVGGTGWRVDTARVTGFTCCVSQGLLFHTLDPCRVVDTRPDSGAPIGGPILISGTETTLLLANTCGIPPTARAVSANLAGVGATGPGFLVFYPVAGAPTPSSNLSFNGGFTRANNAMLGLNALGQTQVLAIVNNPAGADAVHLVLDVNGYFE